MLRKIKLKFNIISAIALLVVCVIFCVSVCFAWFTMFQDASPDNMQFETDNKNIEFKEYFVLTRTIEGVSETRTNSYTYVKHTDGNYYLYNAVDEEFYLLDGSMIPVNLSGLFPSETVVIDVWFRPTGSLTQFNYDFGVSRISASKNSASANEQNGFFEYNENLYSILGVFAVSCDLGGYTDSDGDGVKEEEWSDAVWLCDYDVENSSFDQAKNAVTLLSGEEWDSTAADEDGYLQISVKIDFDLTQYRAANIQQANLISEFLLDIGRIFVSVK